MNRRTFQTLTLTAGASSLFAVEAFKPKIKIGQIGTRHAHAGGQLAALRKCPDFEVVGVVEADPVRRKILEASADYAGLPWLTDEQLLSTPGLQAVAVESEVAGLLIDAEKVVNAGFHLHLDKPAGESLPQFRRILESATAQKRLVKMGYMLRYNPAFELMIQAVREGWLGEVFSVHAEMSKLLSDAERAPMVRYKGGSMFELGCHIIDSVVRVLGKPRLVSPHIHESREDGYADNMLAVLDYPRATATVRSSMVEVDGGARRQFVVCGTKGSVEIRPLESSMLKLTLTEPHGQYQKGTQEVKLPAAPRYLADWFAFAKAIRGETEWEFTATHDLTVQETVLRASGLSLI
jgi:predicted dehydrogenase